jgi:PAS domain S-box-containing protein
MTQALAPGHEPDEPLPLDWGPVLQQHPLPHYVYDPVSLALLAANDPALVRYGYSRQDMLQLTREDLLMPGQMAALRAFLAGLPETARAQPQPVWLERSRDGRVLYSDIRGRSVIWQGRPARLAVVVDASARVRMAADADSARDLLVVAGRLARVGSWWADPERRVVYASDLVCELHELPPGTMLPLDKASAPYPGDAAARMDAAVAACLREGVPFDLELPLITARGQQRWVRTVGEAVRDENGRIVMLRGAQQDVTTQVLDKQALSASQQRLQALLAALPDLCIVFDAQRRYEEINDPQHTSLAGSWAERIGRRMEDVVDADFAAEVMRLMDLAHATGQSQSHEVERPVASGQRRHFESRYVPLEGGRTLALVRDVTETHRMEQRFRAIADATPIGIFTTDAAGLCTYTNAAWQSLFGLSQEQSLGDGWGATVHADDRAAVFAEWQRSSAAAQPFEMEFRVCTPQGVLRHVWSQARPIVRADGVVSAHVGAVADVTQARELAQARQAQAVAEESGSRQRVFLSRVSHELRTPLNAILGFGEVLLLDLSPADARAAGYVRHMVDAGRHMLALVDDLLQLQRIEQGRLDLRPAELDAAGLLQASARLLVPMAESAGITLEVLPPQGLTLVSDERSVKQILLNLGSNAIKYAGRAAQVRLTAQVDGPMAVFTVADSGPGMSPEQLQRLFQPFERLGQDSQGVAGSGLGLVISRQLAQALGGDLQLASAPGHGTRASLRLPLAQPQPGAQHPGGA